MTHPTDDIVTIDLRAVMMEQIEEAAAQSPWVPPEYTMNEVISDCCAFLRENRPDPAKAQELVDDGRPCVSDLFLVALFDQINDIHDREYFIKAWLEGDWECATSEITIGAAK